MTTSTIQDGANPCREATVKKRHERREVASACCEAPTKRKKKKKEKEKMTMQKKKGGKNGRREGKKKKGEKGRKDERGARGQTWMRGTDVQEGRKLARLETISAVIYDALLVFQLCISRRGNELAAMLYVHTSMDIEDTNLFFLLLFNSFMERVESNWLKRRWEGRGRESDQGKSP